MASPIPPASRALDWLRAHAYVVLAPVGALLLFFALQNVTFFQAIENKTIDARFRIRQGHDRPADPRLLLVGIDEYSLSALGSWPWARTVHGDLLQLLTQVNPAVVGWDILFTEPKLDNPAADAALAEGTAALDSVVTGAITETEPNRNTVTGPAPDDLTQPFPHVAGDIRRLRTADPKKRKDKGFGYGTAQASLPIPPVRKNSYFGFVDSNPGLDGVRRKMPMVVRVGESVYPSLDTQILMRFWKLRPRDVRVDLGRSIDFPTPDGVVRVPIDESGQVWINYRNESSFHEISYGKLMGALQYIYQHQQPWPAKNPPIEGRILLVGQTQLGLTDLGPSPLAGISPLVLTHLNILNNILKNDYLRQPGGAGFLVWIGLAWLLVAYPTLWLARNTPVAVSVALPLGIVGVYLAAATLLFARCSLVLPVVWPVLAFLLIHFGSIVIRWLAEQRKNQELKAVFASYVSPGVMKKILDRPDSVHLTGENKEVTIFFSDIRSFSSFSEAMTEHELVRQLNEYFEPMVGAVFRYEGTLHKYIGDAVMAVWGDVLPTDPAVAAKNAVRAALTMRRELTKLNEKRVSEGLFKFHIGMGLNHGGVVVGDIGSSHRREFTVIGDAVNLASRLEGVTKQFHTDLCVGETVQAFLGPAFLVRTIGLLVVKGKTKPVRVFEVIDEEGRPKTTDFEPDWVRAYEEGFNWYLERKFAEAAARFEECLKTRPDDFCADLYLKEAKRLLQEPPGDDWKGVVKLDSK